MRWVAAGSLALPACLHPAESGSAGGPATAEGATQETEGNTRRLVLWDGAHIPAKNVGMGRTGRMVFGDGGGSWASCDAKPNCTAVLEVAPGAGVGGHKGLKFHAEGSGWIGSGWSWFDWYPATAGSDLTPYKNLTFQVRIEASSQERAPDPANISVSLVSNGHKKSSAQALLRKYDDAFDDGRWHKIAIPIADFTSGSEGADFDPKVAWEVRLSTWNPSSRDFNLYIDQIAAEN
ncbi:MAG TPA: hypothetical protein VGM06_22135 [Polyangiaceae bacterium]